jgi:hypothetical protein
VKVLEGKYDDRTPTGRQDRPYTEREIQEYNTWARAVGGCNHQPRCEDRAGCMARFIKRRRGEAA